MGAIHRRRLPLYRPERSRGPAADLPRQRHRTPRGLRVEAGKPATTTARPDQAAAAIRQASQCKEVEKKNIFFQEERIIKQSLLFFHDQTSEHREGQAAHIIYEHQYFLCKVLRRLQKMLRCWRAQNMARFLQKFLGLCFAEIRTYWGNLGKITTSETMKFCSMAEKWILPNCTPA